MMADTSTDLIKSAIENIIYQNKGHNIVTFDVQDRTIIARYIIIASGDSNRHVKALAQHIIKNFKQYDKVDVDGIDRGDWVILNIRDIMIHIFRPEVRDYYNIEMLWN